MYYGDFTEWTDVLSDFCVDAPDVMGAIPIFAAYSIDGYDGSASVVYVKDGKFWLVEGSHCSCFGLEGQWEPEEMSYEALKHLAEKGKYSFSEYSKEFIATLDVIINGYGLDGASPEEIEFMLRLAV